MKMGSVKVSSGIQRVAFSTYRTVPMKKVTSVQYRMFSKSYIYSPP